MIKLFLLGACIMAVTYGRGAAGSTTRRRREREHAEEQHKKDLVNTARYDVKNSICEEIEDDNLMMNCLYYNTSPKCFS